MSSSLFHLVLRRLRRNRLSMLINIGGLAVGIACCLLIALWIRFECSYDRFHEHLDDIQLVGTYHQRGDFTETSAQSPPALGPALWSENTEVLEFTRFNDYGPHVLQHGEVRLLERLHRADPGFFRLFSFRFLSGDPQTAFAARNSIVLTASAAQRFFGDEDPLGKSLRLDYEHDMLITGVVEDVPANSTLRFRYLVPFEYTAGLPGMENYLSTWYNCSFSTYIRLAPGVDARAFGQKIADRVARSDPQTIITAFLFPMRDLNLRSITGSGGFIVTLTMFGAIALLILLIACINYTNLATAQAAGRSLEVGVRKVVGASRADLMRQFYVESLLQALLALLLALILVEQFLPHFRDLVYWADLDLDLLGDPVILLTAIGIVLVTALVAGSLPAIVLSSLQPVTVLKGVVTAGPRAGGFRRALVVVQFAATLVLIISTSVVYDQYEHMERLNLGYDPAGLLYIPLDRPLRGSYPAIKNELLRIPGVQAVTKANRSLRGIYTNGSGWDWEGRDPGVDPLVTYFGVGLDFMEVFGLELAEGRAFAESDRGNHGRDVMINESFARMLGEGPAVGRILRHPDHDDPEVDEYRVIGVVRDFHYKPVWTPIAPLLIEFDNERSGYLLFVKCRDGGLEGTVTAIEAVYHRFWPDRTFDCTFVEDEYEGVYRFVRYRGDILKSFAVVAGVLSSLGLFGLVSHMTRQRTREIGIRKVLGASSASIAGLLTLEIVRWVLVANLVALPLAYVIVRRYLEGFAYRAPISPLTFVLASALSLALAVATVCHRTLRAARADPAEAIRYE